MSFKGFNTIRFQLGSLFMENSFFGITSAEDVDTYDVNITGYKVCDFVLGSYLVTIHI